MSGWMSASAVRESFLDATSVFYSSDADVYTGFAVLFAMVSIAGFVLLTVGVSRAVKRADQRYDGWFRTLYPGSPAAPQSTPRAVAGGAGSGPGTPSLRRSGNPNHGHPADADARALAARPVAAAASDYSA